MTNTEAGAPSECPKEAPTNPYTMTLLWVAIIAIPLAGMLAFYGNQVQGGYDPSQDDGVIQLALAGLFSNLGVGALLLWILVGALTWKPKA